MIAIPNMEIPKTCGECELRALDEWEDEYCVILGDDILVPYERMLDCPLIEIPTPHGRIIDEDEIYEQPHCGECNDATLDAIHNAPTILEAEP